MTELPEERQAALLRRVAELGTRRAELRHALDEVTEELHPLVLEAAASGAVMSRVIELSDINRVTVYRWLKDQPEAPMRPRQHKKARGRADDTDPT